MDFILPYKRGDLPVMEMLVSHINQEQASFHMPGHCRGKSFSSEFIKNLPYIDTTELKTTYDLNNPSGPVKQAMELAREAFGSLFTFFMTSGSTSSVYAALISCASANDKIIVFRNAHKSVINACRLFNFRAVFVSEKTYKDALFENSDAKCVIITRPDYYGNCPDISDIISEFQSHSIPVIVDEAHGTHLKFCPGLFPSDALSMGADFVIHSAHKTVPALTPGSFLHIGRNFKKNISRAVLFEEIQSNISRVTTSSPSYPIAASLDYARFYLSVSGSEKYRQLYENIGSFFLALKPQFKRSFPQKFINFISDSSRFTMDFDFSRIVLNTDLLPLSSFELYNELYSAGIIPEFFDLNCIVFICKPENSPKDFILLANSLNSIYDKYSFESKYKNSDINLTNIQRAELKTHLLSIFEFPDKKVRDFGRIETLIRQNALYEFIPLDESLSRISAESIIPYPPGIPLILPGDEINSHTVNLINRLLEGNLNVNGVFKGFDINLPDNGYYIKVLLSGIQ